MIKPINPGPLVMSDQELRGDGLGKIIISVATEVLDGNLARMAGLKNWPGHAAWLVRASNEHEALVETLTELLNVEEQGLNGGALTSVTFHYEDGDEDGYGHETITKARAVLKQATEDPK